MSAPITDLFDVFSAYDGGTVFRGLAEGSNGQPPVLARVGWLFTGGGALFVLWGFVLRAQRGGSEEKLGEISKTLLVLAALIGGPFAMQATMTAADSLYANGPGDPGRLAYACAKAAYAMPELSRLFDVLGRDAVAPTGATTAAQQQRAALLDQANDGSILGYVEAYGVAVWDTAAGYDAVLGAGWDSAVRIRSLATGLGAAMLKCLLIAVTLVPLYCVFLVAAALVWFMMQLRFFFAVSGTMMLPLFIGMFSMPAGHFSRTAAQNYITNMVALALWPVAWAIGHTGTIVLYDALISLLAGTSRVPEITALLQWSAVTTASPTEAQLQATEAALGNWFMGNLSALLALLVGGVGFVIWVGAVAVLGPVALHRMLAAGAGFMSELAKDAVRQTAAAGRVAAGVAGSKTFQAVVHGAQDLPAFPGPIDQRASSYASLSVGEPPGSTSRGGKSMADAAHWIDISSSQSGPSLQN